MTSGGSAQFIDPLKFYMICAGAWRRPLAAPKMNILYGVYSIFMRASYLAFCVLIWAEFLRLLIQKYHADLVLSDLFVVLVTGKIAIKMAIYWKNGVSDIFDTVVTKGQEVWSNGDPVIRQFYCEKIKVCRYFLVAQAIPSFVAIFAMQITGIIGNYRLLKYNESHNDTLETHYGYQFYLPVNKLDHIWLFYNIQAVLSWTGYNYNCVSHMTVSTLLIFGSLQLEILQIRIRKVIAREENGLNVASILAELKDLISEHKVLIRFIQHLNQSIRSVIFIEYVSSSVDMASAVLELIKVTSIGGIMLEMLFIAVLCVQTFILAWTANEVKIQSEAIADAAFTSKWYLLNKEGQYMIHLIIARAQRSLAITIGPFGAMTTQSAVLIMRAAYSYVSIMRK